MRLAVLGLGLIGGSVALAARRRHAGALEIHVTGYDPDGQTVATALSIGAIDSAAASVAEAVAGADVVVAATPVGVLPRIIRAALLDAPAGCVVTDVGSTKRAPLEGLEQELQSGRLIGGHPLAGAERGGIERASATLFEGACWCLTPAPAGGWDERRRTLLSLVERLGAHPVEISPERHDRTLALVSHLPHVIANVLAIAAAAEREPSLRLAAAGPSFRDATRVAGASSAIWTDIYLANADMLIDAIDATVESLRQVRAALRDGDAAAIDHWSGQASLSGESLRRAASAPEQRSGAA